MSDKKKLPRQFVFGLFGGDSKLITDSNLGAATTDFFTSNLSSVSALQAAGYGYVNITINFMVQQIDDGWVNVYAGSGNSITVSGGAPTSYWGKSFETIDLPNDKSWSNQTATIVVPLSSFTNNFWVAWDASGSGADDYNLSNRSIYIEAKTQGSTP